MVRIAVHVTPAASESGPVVFCHIEARARLMSAAQFGCSKFELSNQCELLLVGHIDRPYGLRGEQAGGGRCDGGQHARRASAGRARTRGSCHG